MIEFKYMFDARAPRESELSPRPNDSFAPARSALSGLCFANSFRRFPSGSSPIRWEREKLLQRLSSNIATGMSWFRRSTRELFSGNPHVGCYGLRG